MSSSRRAIVVVALLFLGGLLVGGFGRASAAPGAKWSRMLVSQAPGDSRAEPVPLGTEVQAGPWLLTVTEVVTGDAAAEQVTQASQFNQGPSDGFAYVVVKILAKNSSDRALAIDSNDFAVSGDSGIVRRFVGAVAPDPPLDGVVQPGESREGWVVIGAGSDEQNLLLVYDSLTLTGAWADRVFALLQDATVADLGDAPAAPNETGTDPTSPAGLNTQIVTDDWAIEILEVVQGAAVFDLYPAEDYRTTALTIDESNDEDPWIAFRVRITNNRTGGDAAYLSPTAFILADSDGNPAPDVLTLTPPRPDASGAYYPGAAREGWVAFEIPVDHGGTLVRFLPFQTDDDPRYFTWGDAPAGDGDAEEEEPDEGPPIAEGSTVEVTDDEVRMRAEPSTDAEIVETLAQGTTLQVTGPAEEGGDYTWYPVTNPESDASGYVAANFLRATE